MPVMVCYDGFLLSHTVMPVELPAQADVDAFLPAVHVPVTILDPADPRNIGPVTVADPRADATGEMCPGYMEIRAHHAALLDALDVIPEVDRDFGAACGRSWGGLTWSHRLEDADVALVAAGSIAVELTVAADMLREEGLRAGVLGLRAYRPFPDEAVRAALGGRRLALVFDKALSYGWQGPICADVKAASYGSEAPPPVFGLVAGLGGRDVSPALLADAVRSAVADRDAGVTERAPAWVNLKPCGPAGSDEGGAR